MKEMSDSEVRWELEESTRIIMEVTGCRPCLFRPPFGEYDKRMLGILGDQGYPYTVMWTVDSHDWMEERNGVKVTEQYLIDRVLSRASDNGIVLMHVGGYETVNALPEIVSGLRAEDYSFVKVIDMLPALPASGNFVHVVKSGDTLYSLARKYGTTVEDIIKANNLQTSRAQAAPEL